MNKINAWLTTRIKQPTRATFLVSTTINLLGAHLQAQRIQKLERRIEELEGVRRVNLPTGG